MTTSLQYNNKSNNDLSLEIDFKTSPRDKSLSILEIIAADVKSNNGEVTLIEKIIILFKKSK